MSDEKLSQSAFPDTEREPAAPPPSTPVRGAALSVLWWEPQEPLAAVEAHTETEEAK